MPNVLLLLLLLLQIGFAASQAECSSSPVCNSSSTGCYGYGVMVIACTNGTVVSQETDCFLSSFCNSVSAGETSDMIQVTMDINPKLSHGYSTEIRRDLLNAYNQWCCQGDNFKHCCPGASAWPDTLARSSCPAAMRSESEIRYYGAKGASDRTEFLLQLRPLANSELCAAVAAQTDAAPTAANATAAADAATTTAAAADAATTTAAAAAAATTTAAADATDGTTAAASGTTAAAGNDTTTAGSKSRRRRATGSIVLDTASVQLLLSNVDLRSLVVGAVSSASNNSVTVSVRVQVHVPTAATLPPQPWNSGWVVATASIGGIAFVGVVVIVVLMVAARSKKSSSL